MTERLSALDTSFLHLEGPSTPMHISSLAVYEGPPPAPGEFPKMLERRLHLAPRFRQRLASVPFDQHRPVWVDDPTFDLGSHLHRVRAPAPGTDAELRELAGDLLSVQLDRDRPLWDMHVIEGLTDDRFAILSKTHHAMWDGVGGADIHSVLLDNAPDTPEETPPAWHPEPPPTGAQLLAHGVRDRIFQPLRSSRRALRHVDEVVASSRQVLEGAAGFASTSLRAAPPSPLNGETGGARRYATVRHGLEDLRRIGRAFDATVNDVVLASVAGALRAWLIHRSIAPYDLRVMVPVSVRDTSDAGASGNRVAMVIARLPVGEADPSRRIEQVHDAMQAEKRSGKVRATEAVTQLAAFAPPQLLAALTKLQSRRWFNVVTTNIPGPRAPLYLRGRRLLELYPQAPLASRQALSVAAMSYNGSMGFGLLADRSSIGDLDVLTESLEESIASLARVAAIRTTPDEPIHDPIAEAPPAELLSRANRSPS